MLAPSGNLVTICINGPRQQKALRDLAVHHETLPRVTFTYTDVTVMIVRINADLLCSGSLPGRFLGPLRLSFLSAVFSSLSFPAVICFPALSPVPAVLLNIPENQMLKHRPLRLPGVDDLSAQLRPANPSNGFRASRLGSDGERPGRTASGAASCST